MIKRVFLAGILKSRPQALGPTPMSTAHLHRRRRPPQSSVRLQASHVGDHFADVTLLVEKAMARVQRTHVLALLFSLHVASVRRSPTEEIPPATLAVAAAK